MNSSRNQMRPSSIRVVRDAPRKGIGRLLTRLSTVAGIKKGAIKTPGSDGLEPDSGVDVGHGGLGIPPFHRGQEFSEDPTTLQPAKFQQSVSLWDEAYEALRIDSEDSRRRVNQYELLLTIKLQTIVGTDGTSDAKHASERALQVLESGQTPSDSLIDSEHRRLQMEKILNAGLQEMDEKRLRLLFGKHEIVVGDQMAKVSDFIQWSQDWVGRAACVHPEASMAWAAISLALPLITNPFTAEEEHASGYEKATRFSRYYASMEKVYLPADLPGRPAKVESLAVSVSRKEVEDGIRNLYKATLDFQIQTVLRLYRSRFKTFFRDVGRLDDWTELASTIEDCHKEVQDCVQKMRLADVCGALDEIKLGMAEADRLQAEWGQRFSMILGIAAEIREKLETLTTDTRQIRQDTQNIRDVMKRIVDNEQRKSLSRLLSKLDTQSLLGANPHDTKSRLPVLLAGTADWVLGDDGFQRWCDYHSGTLLISCPPGCGKSVLAKHLIDTVLPASGRSSVFFFFFDQHSIAQALCAILHQIFTAYQALALPVLSLFEQQTSIFTSRDALQRILRRVLQDVGGAVTIVLDALDQCTDDDAGAFLHGMLEDGNLHVAVTARPFEYILSPFSQHKQPNVTHISGESEAALSSIAKEVRLYIRSHISLLPGSSWSDKEKAILQDRMMLVRNPTYLWARLIFDYIRPRQGHYFYPDVHSIEELVNTLPDDFREAYDKIFSRAPDQKRLQRAMGIIIAAQRPFTVHEMNLAMHIHPRNGRFVNTEQELRDDVYFEQALREWCSLFIVIQNQRVYLLHETAREFFTVDSASWTRIPASVTGSIPMDKAHLMLAEVCMWLLTFDDLLNEQGESILVTDNGLPRDGLAGSGESRFRINQDHPRYSLIIYACLHWASHVQQTQPLPKHMQPLYESLCDPSNAYSRAWLSLYTPHIASAALHYQFLDAIGVKSLLGHKSQVETEVIADPALLRPARDRGGGDEIMSVLFAAVSHKHTTLTKWLLDRGADPNDAWGPHAPLVQLIDDADAGMLGLVPLFLSKGAGTGLVGLDENNEKSPVFTASQRGLSDIVDLILVHEKDAGMRSSASLVCLDETPLHVAMDTATTKVLLNHGADPMIQNSSRTFPLSMAPTIEAKAAIIRSFIASGGSHADLLLMMRQALDHAVTPVEIELYFAHGLNSGTRNRHGSLPLFSIGCLQEDIPGQTTHQTAMMQELLRHCDPETQNRAGLTALLHYVCKGATAATRVLLSGNVDLRVRDAEGATILHHASRIITVNGSPDRPSKELTSAVLQAVRKHNDILHAQTTGGATALHYACRTASIYHVRLLLDAGLDTEARDCNGRTPLLNAIRRRAEWHDVLELLVNRGADVHARDFEGQTLLHGALIARSKRMSTKDLRGILDNIAEFDVQDSDGLTPLMHLLGQQQLYSNELLSILLDQGAKCNIIDYQGRYALHHLKPTCGWSAASIQDLVDKGADIGARTTAGESPLHTILIPRAPYTPTAMWHQPQIVSALLRVGAEVDAQRHDGKTPLHLACLNGCDDSAKVLLEAGANLAAVDMEGRTPLDLVSREDQQQIFKSVRPQVA